MKYFIYNLLFLMTFYCNAQNKKPILREFIIEKDLSVLQNQKFLMQTMLLKDADQKKIPVKINMTCDVSLYNMSGMNAEKLDKIIKRSNIESMFAVKNRYTFLPKSMIINYSRIKNKWQVSLEYVAQNDYGALKDGFIHLVFDNNGEFIEIE